jgi:hypothetical protein
LHAFSKTLVLLLLAAVVFAPWAVQVLRSDTISHERVAGCHEDNGNVPVPTRISRSCGRGEHHPAILQQNSVSRPLLQISAAVESSLDAAAVAAFDPFPRFVVASGGSPVMSSLRVQTCRFPWRKVRRSILFETYFLEYIPLCTFVSSVVLAFQLRQPQRTRGYTKDNVLARE